MLRDTLRQALTTAMKDKNAQKVATLRLVMSTLKSKDIDARTEGNHEGISDVAILAMLQSMIKQRRESITLYSQGGRTELAAKEQEEIDIIQEFLPQPLSEDELNQAIRSAIASLKASGSEVSVKDMGKVMGYMKDHFTGRIDFSTLGPKVKELLSA